MCPFHAWKFDGGGKCVEIPYASRVPPKAKVDCWPVAERNGMIYVWHDPERGAPDWEIPEIADLTTGEFTGWNHSILEIKTHPREIVENIVDTATPDFRKVIETDLIGPFALAREVGRHMLARQYGRIVNISSIMAVLGRETVAGYVSAKHGMTGLTKNLAAEFGPYVTANAIAPGYIRTELNVPLQKDKDFCAMLEQRTAASRWGTPADLRGALLLLASDAGAYITGHTLVVDGGMTTILA